MSTGPAVAAIPGNREPASAATWRASAAAISALDGTHPVFTQVPPNVPRSIITTDLPSVVARIAAANAAPPDPITARSIFDWHPDPPRTVGILLIAAILDLPVQGKVKREPADTRGVRMRIGELAERGRHHHEDAAVLRRPGAPAAGRAHARRLPRLHPRDASPGSTSSTAAKPPDSPSPRSGRSSTSATTAKRPASTSATCSTHASTDIDLKLRQLHDLRDTIAGLRDQAEHVEPDTCSSDQVCRYL